MKIGNLRFPKVFVFNPGTELVVDGTTKPYQLSVGQVAIINSETGVATDGTPVRSEARIIEIHQNLGDNKHGTVRTGKIALDNVIGWHAKKATVAAAQITYVGYDETDNTKQLRIYNSQLPMLAISIYDNELTKIYGETGYTKLLTSTPASCVACATDCELLDQDAIADDWVAQINGTDSPNSFYPTNNEMKNFMVAVKVATGTVGQPDRRVGIKITSLIPPPETIDRGNPQQFFRPNTRNFTVAIPMNCPNVPITTTQKPKAGAGYPLEVTDLEKESQGYDRVRNTFEDYRFMKDNFILRAADGSKYDFYFLEYNEAHSEGPGLPGRVWDPKLAIFIVPTGTGANLQTAFNSWLTPQGFASVTIAASTGIGTTPENS